MDESRLMIVSARSVSDSRRALACRLLSTVPMLARPTLNPAAAAISPDGRMVVIGSEVRHCRRSSTRSTGQLRAPAERQRAVIASVVYPSDGRTVVSVASDDSVIAWDPRTVQAERGVDRPVWARRGRRDQPGWEHALHLGERGPARVGPHRRATIWGPFRDGLGTALLRSGHYRTGPASGVISTTARG